MTFQQLQYVVALDTHRHFMRAAESCFVAQPTLTLQVKKLEKQIDLVIFDRSAQPLVPTPMGKVFVAKAREILHEVEQLKQLVNDDRNQVEGTFRIGIIPTLAQYLLPRFLPSFTKNLPQTKLKIMELQSDKIIDGINKQNLDIGIMVTPTKEPSIREIKLFDEPFLLYANQNNQILGNELISDADLDEQELWLLDQGHCFRDQIINICGMSEELTLNRNIVFESGSIETLKKMIQQTNGYTLIPELAFQESEQNQVRRFASPEPAREVSLMVSKSFTKELLLDKFRRAIVDAVPSSFKKNTRFRRIDWR